MPITDNTVFPSPLAFVTGATGLLGNNLVRELIADGWRVRALARSPEKAAKQFAGLDLEIVTGDMLDIPGFANALLGVDVVFHTAAYFRDSYKGGRHWDALYAANVEGTRALLDHAWSAGVRRVVHTSSIAVLRGIPGQIIDETMLRDERDADDYYRSKILADRAVLSFLDSHPDFWAVMVLPGWMHGPGDIGPTSAGQTVLDVAFERLPGVPPGSFSVVDARDVAKAMILANKRGRRGERYLAAGRHMTMGDLLPLIAQAVGVGAPTRRIPLFLLYLIGAGNELYARITGRPVLLSWAMARTVATENDRSRYDPARSKRELGLEFRPVTETLRDEVDWFRRHGVLPN
ncbi:NAD-dependent epimerase/dehydratase [Novosphingobium sp. Rr 2-17]|uniref:SDR family oxidoreductase n=1 Tax=Novosphingobium sp. Rr 2-17 TaxID=555793 RepID=UPI00026981F1|nr:SDR family oxidoreductase [Novosphingobium sp. Rr 2-17]EIZ79446.1 NAD-dependent epimerase/dehydratase [Novosphingobium sp. Rr 2-17]